MNASVTGLLKSFNYISIIATTAKKKTISEPGAFERRLV